MSDDLGPEARAPGALRLTRRALLAASGLGPVLARAAQLALRPSQWGAGHEGSSTPVPGSPGARHIARVYLEMHPEEADRRVLLRLVGACDDPRRDARGADSPREVFRAQRRADFGKGDIVVVDGWVLSRTECRHCALTLFG